MRTGTNFAKRAPSQALALTLGLALALIGVHVISYLLGILEERFPTPN